MNKKRKNTSIIKPSLPQVFDLAVVLLNTDAAISINNMAAIHFTAKIRPTMCVSSVGPSDTGTKTKQGEIREHENAVYLNPAVFQQRFRRPSLQTHRNR